MITEYENLKFTNSFMFCHIMRKNPELCRDIVETILDVKVREIIKIDDEESIKTSSDGHGVRLDVYLEGDDAVYDIEMQTTDTGNLRKRSRYYQSVLDTDILKSGEDYDTLKKTFVIFICTFDLFGRGLPKYTFRNACLEKPELELGDESIKVFLNAEAASSEPSIKLKEFLNYLTDETIGGELTERIDDELQEALRNEEMRSRYMTYEWELASKYREGLKEGMAAGHAEGKSEERMNILKMLMKKLSPEDVISLGFTEEEIHSIQ